MSGLCLNLRQAALSKQLDASSPGPAAYASTRAMTVTLPSSPRQPIGLASRSPKLNNDAVPGPGAYSLSASADACRHASPRQPIGRASRQASAANEDVPGPAAYEMYRVDTMTGRSISSGRPTSARAVIGRAVRQDLASTAVSPGPAYSPRTNFVLANSPAFSVGKATRDSGATQSGPGPQDYSAEAMGVMKPTSPRQPIGNALRSPNAHSESVPGPGAYSLSASADACRPASPRQPIGRASRLSAAANEDVPGPAAYEMYRVDTMTGRSISSGRPTSARAVIGRAVRQDLASTAVSPGPAYSPRTNFVLANSPAFSLGKAPRDGSAGASSALYSPGPQDYASEAMGVLMPASPRQAIGKAERWGSARSATSGVLAPGPGAYDVAFR